MEKLNKYINTSAGSIFRNICIGVICLILGAMVFSGGKNYLAAFACFIGGAVVLLSALAEPFFKKKSNNELQENPERALIVSDFQNAKDREFYRMGEKYLFIKEQGFCKYSEISHFTQLVTRGKYGKEQQRKLLVVKTDGTELLLTNVPLGGIGKNICEDIVRDMLKHLSKVVMKEKIDGENVEETETVYKC